ncbi:MAG: MBL fold metallo-hydrolase [Candidatus Dormibacteraeota bacterium]|nr:MBL fold metallo-hydrolase [Candidatus Dormibacteraeota bacterium]
MASARTALTFLHTGNPTGLKFIVEHGQSRALFDFGREHAPGRAPFSIGLEPRPGRELSDLLRLGEAQAIPGVYAGDAWDGLTSVFISHMHLDHTGLVPYLGPGVPLYYPEGMEPVRDGAARSGYLRWRDPAGRGVAAGDSVRLGDMSVRFIAVDHDVPGASGFLITTPAASIAFTGDHRWHGLHPELTERFADEVRGADVLIQEAVSLGFAPLDVEGPPPPDEEEVIRRLQVVTGESPGLVIVNCYGMNRERVFGVAAGCAAAGRTLLMEPQMAALAGWTGVFDPGSPGSLEPIIANPRGFCLQLGFESLPALIDIEPPAGSVYVHSGGVPLGPYDPAFPVMEAWVSRFALDYQVINTSGHSRPPDIARMVGAVRPRVVLPVHSRAPEQLQVVGVPTFVPTAGITYDLAALLLTPGSRT